MTSTTEEKLKPCPWCNESDRLVVGDSSPNQSCVICLNCGATGPLVWGHDDNQAGARVKWDALRRSPSRREVGGIKTVEDITGPCRCIEGFKIRGMIDPNCVYHDLRDDIQDLLDAARCSPSRKAVLEEAARVAEEIAERWRVGPHGDSYWTADSIVKAIRALAEEE